MPGPEKYCDETGKETVPYSEHSAVELHKLNCMAEIAAEQSLKMQHSYDRERNIFSK